MVKGAVRWGVSIHAPLTGGDVPCGSSRPSRSCFNPRPPHGRRHHRTGLPPAQTGFNPRPPHGRRPLHFFRSPTSKTFQSTPPSREATAQGTSVRIYPDVSIHAPLTGGDEHFHNPATPKTVSIHAPLTGGDGSTVDEWARFKGFNPRPPHGRRRLALRRG